MINSARPRRVWAGLGFGLPVAVAIVVAAFIMKPVAASPIATATVVTTPAPVSPTSAQTSRSPSNTTATAPTAPARTTPVAVVTTRQPTTVPPTPTTVPPTPPPSPQPQGRLTIDTFTNHVAMSPACSNTELTISNRSDTAVRTVTVNFRTSYSPKGKNWENFKDGPAVSVTEPLGLAPYQSTHLTFHACVPSLRGQIEPDAYDIEELSAVPTTFTWTWFGQP